MSSETAGIRIEEKIGENNIIHLIKEMIREEWKGISITEEEEEAEVEAEREIIKEKIIMNGKGKEKRNTIGQN